MDKQCHLLTNRLSVSWAEPTLIAARYSVARLRFPKANRWIDFCKQLSERPSFSVVEGCLFSVEEDLQWYYVLYPTKQRQLLQADVALLGDSCQSVWYDSPTDIPDYLFLRLLLNAIQRIGKSTNVYNLFGTPILFDPRNFRMEGIHPAIALIGVSLTLTKELCLVAQTKTFSRVWYPPKDPTETPLYALDPSSNKLNRLLLDTPYDPEQQLYTPKTNEPSKRHVVAQFKLSPNKALNCKTRVQWLLLDAFNTTFKDICTLQFTTIQNAIREFAPYSDKLIEVQRSTLHDLTISVEDLVNHADSAALKARFKELIQAQQYHFKSDLSAHREADYLRWTDQTKDAQLLIQLVPTLERDTDNASYLKAFQEEPTRWRHQQIQHVQVRKLFNPDAAPAPDPADAESNEKGKRVKKKPQPKEDEIDPTVVLPRLVTELTIKHIIAGRRLLSPTLSRQFEGWQIGIAKYYTEQRQVVGGFLDIVGDGYLSFYAVGSYFWQRKSMISQLDGLIIGYADYELEQMFCMRETGGTGPFYHIKLPNRKSFILTEGAEHALPNLEEIDKRVEARVVKPTYSYIIEVLQQAGLTDLPDFQTLFGIKEKCTKAQVKQIGDYISETLNQPKITKELYEHVNTGLYNYLKRKETLLSAFGGMTDIYWWIEQGDLRYVSAMNHHLPNLTSSWKIPGMPHVRTIHCLDDEQYFDQPKGKANIPTFIDSLKCGFGRYDAATCYPMPFKILEEWLDQVSLSTTGMHWSALNTARIDKSAPTPEPVNDQEF